MLTRFSVFRSLTLPRLVITTRHPLGIPLVKSRREYGCQWRCRRSRERDFGKNNAFYWLSLSYLNECAGLEEESFGYLGNEMVQKY